MTTVAVLAPPALATGPESAPPAPVAAPNRIPTAPPGVARRPAGARELFRLPLAVLGRAWPGGSLQAASKQKLPIALLFAVGLFGLVQALVDRRDPKVSRAPEHQQEDSVGFQ